MRPYRFALFFMSFLLGALALAMSELHGRIFQSSLTELQFSRALLAIATGSALGGAGALLQAVFSNPLCDPYILGVSSGGVLGAVIGMSLGLSIHWIHAGSFLGCLLFTGILQGLLSSRRSDASQVLFFGILLGLFGSGILTIWMAVADPMGVYGALLWMLGDLGHASVGQGLFLLMVVLLILVWVSRRSHELDLLMLGDFQASSMGLDLRKARRRWIWIASLLVSLSVSHAGMIGFVGLTVPHLARAIVGASHRKVFPFSCLLGAVLLLLSDHLGRWILSPVELPVGVICTLWGAPALIFLLWKGPVRLMRASMR